MAQSKKGFGSFHTEDVEDLVRRTQDAYLPPFAPIELPEFPSDLEFGDIARGKLFLLDPKWVFLNHGAFGAANTISFKVAQAYQRYLESQPLRFVDRFVLPALADVTRELARFIRCPAEELALVTNATSALNAVFHSISLKRGDHVFIFDTAYGSVKKMARELCRNTGAVYDEAILQFPINCPNEILRQAQEQIQPGTKLAVFDHISSNTAILFPIHELARFCRESTDTDMPFRLMLLYRAPYIYRKYFMAAKTCVKMSLRSRCDLDISNLGVDFYVGNCHKWLTTPKGAGFLFAENKHHGWLRAANISHGWGRGFVSEFMWSGTHDYSALLSVKSAIKLWQHIGRDRVNIYCNSLLDRAVHILVEAWGTSTLVPLDAGLNRWMILVGLPQDIVLTEEQSSGDSGDIIQNMLYSLFQIEVPIKTVEGHLYVRISVHIYNTEEQFLLLAQAVNALRSETNVGHC